MMPSGNTTIISGVTLHCCTDRFLLRVFDHNHSLLFSIFHSADGSLTYQSTYRVVAFLRDVPISAVCAYLSLFFKFRTSTYNALISDEIHG